MSPLEVPLEGQGRRDERRVLLLVVSVDLFRRLVVGSVARVRHHTQLQHLAQNYELVSNSNFEISMPF